MELISKTEDENDLLYLYSAVIRVVFNDRIEEEEIEQLESYMERVLRNVQNYEKQPTRTEVSK